MLQRRSSPRVVQGEPTLCACSMLTLIWSVSGPPFPVLPGGLQLTLPFTSKFILRLSGSVSVFDPTLASSGHFNQKCLDVGTKGRSRILRDARMSQRAGGGRSRRLRDREGCRAPCQLARPLRRAGTASAHRMGLRKCSCQESEASLGSSRRLCQSLPRGRWRIPHLLISLSALGRTVCPPVHPLRTASQPQAIRLRRAHHLAHVSHAARVFLFQSALHILCVQKHSPIPAVRVDD